MGDVYFEDGDRLLGGSSKTSLNRGFMSNRIRGLSKSRTVRKGKGQESRSQAKDGRQCMAYALSYAS